MVDYIVVGTGLAGIAFTEKLAQEGKTFIVIDAEERSSSLVAGGMYNPVVLKRFTDVWKVNEQLALADVFYPALEAKLQIKCWYPMDLYRRLASVEEQNNWFQAADRPNLSAFLSPEIEKKKIDGVDLSFGLGKVNATGYLETDDLIPAYRQYLSQIGCYKKESFDYDALVYTAEDVSYKGIHARNIVFAEGFGMLQNPFFNTLPLDGTKGELMIVKIPNLNCDFMLKAGVFLIPIGNDHYKLGATYNWEDKTDVPTAAGAAELLDGLRSFIDLDFEVIEHLAGVRPTVKDRRPLLGRSLESNRIYVLNGLGTRGVLLAPYLAEQLYNYIENNIALDENISIHRYKKFKLKK
ncbi:MULTISPECIES: FAD-dependent oxidoreductase [unclassified Myroides]|uniref:NAD(P)/FAD-dependent oxidoreductase n=1 Tax=unclassified Myroides TaxID=2642485 RepID=UPI0015F7C43E|nr:MULTISPECIES: FAD-dependent oxidoreductase [unclassified Myroides]MBB1150065.1 FAD-binding oxidoreductase [Myroides sp. NP-2]MDM1407256.1 FAD-binding oxidoreductase [Myroides sp. DF42-4-2]